MSFSFSQTAGTSQSTAKPKLAGNSIHTVKLGKCETQDIDGVKEPGTVYKVIKVNFYTEDGNYEHTVFEPRPEDFSRTETEYIDKSGKKNKIPQPANTETMMFFFKHVIDGFLPELAKEIDNKTKSLDAPDWDSLRSLIVQIFTKAKGRENKIKLIKDKNGDGRFPGFFTGISREGEVYVRNNFIGEKIAFNSYELGKIQNETAAKPTNMNDLSLEDDSTNNDLNLDIDISDI